MHNTTSASPPLAYIGLRECGNERLDRMLEPFTQLQNRIKVSIPTMVVHHLSDLSKGLLTRSKLVGGVLCLGRRR